jgi:hypothetical protein
MAADRNARARLVQFLDQKAFDPILRARPDRYSENDTEKLQHVKDATRIVPGAGRHGCTGLRGQV